MIIDKKGKLFGKVSIIDLLIVAIVVVGIAGVIYKLNTSGTVTTTSGSNKIEMSLHVVDLETYAIENIEIGDVAKDYQSNVTFGTVTDMRVKDTITEYLDGDGQLVMESASGKYILELDLEGSGAHSSTGPTTIGGKSYFINRSLEVQVGDVILWARISDISPAE